MALTVAELAERLGARLYGSGHGRVTAVGAIEAAGETDVTFAKPAGRYGRGQGRSLRAEMLERLHESKAAAVIVGRYIEGVEKPQLVVENVDAALIKALELFAVKLERPKPGIDAAAIVGNNVKVAPSASVGAGVVLEEGVSIGENSVIGPGCKIGQNSSVGANCRLDCNVVVYHNCRIGNNVVIQANTTIGSTGFGYSFIEGSHRLIPHNGGVVIEDCVEIGANCCVDRAKFGNTIIGAGTKIDNLVQIAHNVVIGKCCLIAAQVGIAGSSRLDDGVVLGGQVGVSDHVHIGPGTMVGAQAGVMSDVGAKQKVTGMPARDVTQMLRIIASLPQLPGLVREIKQLSNRIKKLEASEDDKK